MRRRVPRRALPHGAQPRQGDAVRVVAEPVHGLRPPLHVLLCPRLRAAGRPPLRRPLRPHDPRQAEHRRRPPRRARAALVGARGGDDRRRHRPVPAGRRALPAHPRVHRRARACPHPHLDHHARPARVARRRRAPGGGPAGRGLRQRLRADARRPRLAHDRAGNGAAAQAARDRAPARRRRHPHERRHRTDPARPLRPPELLAEAVRAARQAGAHHIWASRPPPATRNARALPRGARTRLALGERALRAALRGTELPADERDGARARPRRRARPRARERRQTRAAAPPGPTQLTLV